MKRAKWIAAVLAAVAVSGFVGFKVSEASEGGGALRLKAGPLRRAYWRALGIKTSPLRLKVVDAVTQKGINGAGCIVGETGDRVETNANGVAPVIDAPIFRHPRLEEMLAQLHGQLTVLCYKNGYRDQIYMGVRMHEGVATEPEIWMYPVGPRDRRIEPMLYQVPIHRLWQIQLADKYRLREEGEGPESPQLTRPDVGQVPEQMEQGGGVQTPVTPAPDGARLPSDYTPPPPTPQGTEPQTPLRQSPPPPQNVPR